MNFCMASPHRAPRATPPARQLMGPRETLLLLLLLLQDVQTLWPHRFRPLRMFHHPACPPCILVCCSVPAATANCRWFAQQQQLIRQRPPTSRPTPVRTPPTAGRHHTTPSPQADGQAAASALPTLLQPPNPLLLHQPLCCWVPARRPNRAIHASGAPKPPPQRPHAADSLRHGPPQHTHAPCSLRPRPRPTAPAPAPPPRGRWLPPDAAASTRPAGRAATARRQRSVDAADSQTQWCPPPPPSPRHSTGAQHRATSVHTRISRCQPPLRPPPAPGLQAPARHPPQTPQRYINLWPWAATGACCPQPGAALFAAAPGPHGCRPPDPACTPALV